VTVTLTEIIDEVLINLSGYTYQQDRSTYLTTAVTTTTSPSTSPTVLSLASTDNVGKGIIEVGEELMWVDSFDRIANKATIAPYGRGYLGTTASTAAVDTKVTISPIFPRYVVKKAVNDTLQAIGSQLLAVKRTSFVYNAAVTTYELTGLNIENILTMTWQVVGPSKDWLNIRRYTFDSFPNAATWGATTQTVTIDDFITSGRTVNVVYTTRPSTLVNPTDDFATVTGLSESVKDVVVLGAVYRLLAYLDPARASQISPQADEIDAKRPFGSANTTSRQIYALFQQRLREEIQAQQTQYPSRVHYTR